MAVGEDWLRQTAAQHGQEVDRAPYPGDEYMDNPQLPGEKVKNPEPRWIISYSDGSKMIVRPKAGPSGEGNTGLYDILDQPAVGAGGGAPHTIQINGRTHMWDQAQGKYVPLGPQVESGAGWRSGRNYQPNPTTGQLEVVGYDEDELARLQQQRDVERGRYNMDIRTEQARRDQEDINNKFKYYEALMKMGEMDDKQAAREFEQYVKLNYEIPREMEKTQFELRDKAETTAATAGTTAVNDYMMRAPYQYSPGFGQRYNAALAGDPRQAQYDQSSIAAPYRPAALNVPQVRQQAENTARQAALDRYGFDPINVAGQVASRPAVAAGAAPAPPADDDEIVRRYVQRLGGAGAQRPVTY